MKFFAFLALVGSASAIRLQAPVSHVHAKAPKVYSMIQTMELPHESEIEQWVHEELERDGSITKKEIKKALGQWEDATGKKVTKEEWKLISEMFDVIDLDGDDKVTGQELQCVFDGENCPEQVKLPELTPEMEKTVEEILTEAFADGKMTKKELKQGLKKFEEAHGKIPSDIKDVIWAMFDLLDANGDKVVTIEEVEAAMKQYS